MSWLMEWRVLAYGNVNASRTRRLAMNALFVAIFLAVYGLWTEFVPSSWVAKVGWYLSTAISVSLGLFISRGYATGRYEWHKRPGALARLTCYALIFAGIYCLAWLTIVRAAPDVATRIFGTYQSQSMVLEASSHWRKRSCDHQLQGAALTFPGYRCVPASDFKRFAPRGEVILSGKSTALGMHLTHVESGIERTRQERD